MELTSIARPSIRFKIGRYLLLGTAGLMAFMHLGLIFFLDDPTLFMIATAFNLYAFIVILVPFSRREKWAWLTTWILPIGLVLPALNDPDIAVLYTVFAVLCAVGLLLARREFGFKNSMMRR